MKHVHLQREVFETDTARKYTGRQHVLPELPWALQMIVA
jgi:hypothetical protein